ncbi:MAG TPA: hypothetical protein VIQ30_06675 [Pseudonocardia sp.]
MSRIDEPVDRASVLFSARLTVDSHNAGRRCQCCTDDGCRQLDWARKSISEHTTPTRRPAA